MENSPRSRSSQGSNESQISGIFSISTNLIQVISLRTWVIACLERPHSTQNAASLERTTFETVGWVEGDWRTLLATVALATLFIAIGILFITIHKTGVPTTFLHAVCSVSVQFQYTAFVQIAHKCPRTLKCYDIHPSSLGLSNSVPRVLTRHLCYIRQARQHFRSGLLSIISVHFVEP